MSAFTQHSRSNSHDTVSSSSSYSLVLEHILSYPGTYDIPLRTMYTLNCAPRAQPLPEGVRSETPSSSFDNSPANSQTHMTDAQYSTAQFTSSLVAQLSQLPHHTTSLPPKFVTNFVKKIFPPELHMVDFPQALTALDYLKDLENRRQKEARDALARLGVEVGADGVDYETLTRRFPRVATWVHALEEKEKHVENFYSTLWVSLRRWILINEMSLPPFNKQNCHAMLNTLYPPVNLHPPTSRLTEETLAAQRTGFFRYIRAVESRGPGVLNNLIKQNKAEGDDNGWAEVERTLEKYLHLANSTIDECQEISGTEFFGEEDQEEVEKRNRKKVDSGYSFGSATNGNRVSATGSTNASQTHSRKTTPTSVEIPVVKSTSTLERIARELRKMRPRSKEVTEIPNSRPPTRPTTPKIESTPAKHGVIKKMRSLGDIKSRNVSSATVGAAPKASPAPQFDKDEMLQQRKLYEASHSRTHMSAHEV
ncbi:hypothetical protein K402DRAFT_423692 [Aulographum hederae CBS 113979]|uniref:Uncharacterized protein n=1 Tax=Aulographum hederae CBS 113979 TaxID=1176131 RepID=A0A6G1GS39_9PEZI|nr:hypothetical protein K402DRAFT_423692 [Aulographum hederae CBS 113979]